MTINENAVKKSTAQKSVALVSLAARETKRMERSSLDLILIKILLKINMSKGFIK